MKRKILIIGAEIGLATHIATALIESKMEAAILYVPGNELRPPETRIVPPEVFIPENISRIRPMPEGSKYFEKQKNNWKK
jgi:hypothetical protein